MANTQIFKKNKIDLDLTAIIITAADDVADDSGQDSVNFLRNRNNTSGWMTTGSDDSATTTLEVDMTGQNDIDTLILINHNFKEFTIKYWNGSSYVDFSTPIAETINADTTSRFQFTQVTTQKIKITITATQTANVDKQMTQLIVTQILGTFVMQPEIKPTIDKGRKATKYLSNKKLVTRTLEAFDLDVNMNNVTDSSDLALAESLFSSYFGFLVWLCGGTQTQYPTIREGYRLQDLYLMNVTNEYKPQFEDSRYAYGMRIDLKLSEVV